jgi:hypothetical protein
MGRKAGFTAVSRADYLGSVTIDTLNKVYQTPGNGGLLPNDYFLYGMFFVLEGRMTNPEANGPTGVNADGVLNLIENISVQGYHRVRGQNENFINIRGVDLIARSIVQGGYKPYVVPSDGWPSFTQALSVNPGEANDFRIAFYLPFVPNNIPTRSQLGWLLDAPNYDRLQINIQIGDGTSVFNGQTTQPTFTAFGSATGSPVLKVTRQMCLGGAAIQRLVPGRMWLYFSENTTGDVLAVTQNSRQFNIPRGNKIRSIMIKSGLKQTGVTTGNNPYASLSDDIITNPKVYRGTNKPIKIYPDFRHIKFETQQALGIYPHQGYAVLDWAIRGHLSEVLDTVGLVAGASGDTDLYFGADIAGAANTGVLYLTEELRGIPKRI